METVGAILSADGKRKVEIFRRANGTFGFSVWRFSAEPLEMCWLPDGHYGEAVLPDAESAEREAQSRVAWLRGSQAGA